MGDACLQTSILDLNFIRPGSLNLTSRKSGERPTWDSDEVLSIEVTLGLGPEPLALRVRHFIAGPDDSLIRAWVGPNGASYSIELAAYAIADVAQTSVDLKCYIEKRCMCLPDAVRESHPIVRRVYSEVEGQEAGLRAAGDLSQADFLRSYCEIWFGIRYTMGSAWISGPEKLGMEPIDLPGYPLLGKISLPRQVVQDVGCILNKQLKPRQAEFLLSLRDALESGNPNQFFTLFLLIFVLLHECEDISKDRARYARQNRLKFRFSLPDFVEALHASARVLADYWLLYSAHLGIDWTDQGRLEASLGFLPEAKKALVLEVHDTIVNKTNPHVCACDETWEKDLCFLTHMFGVPWRSDALFSDS